MKVIDGFSFFREYNLLKLRLHYLSDVVDYFIISEANYTHSGKQKPYYLDDIIDDIPKNIRSKIIRLKYEPNILEFNFPESISYCDLQNDIWKLERLQRNFITENLSQFSPNDIIMISDIDEIPNKEVVKEYRETIGEYQNTNLSQNFCAVSKCKMFYYNFHTFCNEGWFGTAFSTIGHTLQVSCDYLRQKRGNFFSLENGGWHFSTFGSVKDIRTKIQSFAHQEYNKEEYISEENILNSIQNKEDIYHNSGRFQDYDLSNFPKDLQENIIKIFPKEFYQL